MKRTRRWGLWVALLLILFALVCYLLLALYYREGFCLNTWINGVYCTGKTVEEVNTELLLNIEAPIILVEDFQGRSHEILLEQADYQGDYLVPLQQFKEQQNALLWVDNLTFHKEHTLRPLASCDEEKLRKLWEELPFVKEEREKSQELRIYYTEGKGFSLEDGIHDRFDLEKAYEQLKEAVYAGETSISYEAFGDCYDLPMSESEEAVWAVWKQIDRFQQLSLTYDIEGESVEITGSSLAGLLQAEDEMPITDERGNLVIDPKAIKEFVADFSAVYDTVGKERDFVSTKGDVIHISGGIYGRKIDQKAETEFLTEYFTDMSREFPSINHEVALEQTADWGDDTNDIGTTYVEVDMTEQMLYYYENGILKLQTEVVTGNTGRKMGTPTGVNYVYLKQKNRILRGPNYASFVKYWMPVNGGIGIHDASWRSKFGGTIYQTNGSHGCVNMPTDKAGELYEMVELGTPVVMYYRE